MKSSDSGEWWYARYAFLECGIRPSEWTALCAREKAMIIAFIDQQIEQQEKAAKNASKGR